MALIVDRLRLKRAHNESFFNTKIPLGTFCIVMGYSGSGKTSFLHALAGFEPHVEGKILLGEYPIHDKLPADRPLTLLFQKDNLFGHLSVWDNVALGLHGTLVLDEEEKRLLEEALEAVDLMHVKDQPIQNISGGEQQRTALARCLLRRRPLLLLDEPLAFLDLPHQKSVMDLIFKIHEELHLTTLMATHTIHPSWKHKVWVIFLSRCQIVAQGPWDEVWKSAHPDVQDFYRAYLDLPQAGA